MKKIQTGVDIVEIERIRKVIRGNGRFLTRVFTPEEIRYCAGRKASWQHYAVRFAAKEAVWKALGVRGLSHRDIGIKHAPDGKPEVVLPKKFSKISNKLSISLSHSDHYAVAVAVVSI